MRGATSLVAASGGMAVVERGRGFRWLPALNKAVKKMSHCCCVTLDMKELKRLYYMLMYLLQLLYTPHDMQLLTPTACKCSRSTCNSQASTYLLTSNFRKLIKQFLYIVIAISIHSHCRFIANPMDSRCIFHYTSIQHVYILMWNLLICMIYLGSNTKSEFDLELQHEQCT